MGVIAFLCCFILKLKINYFCLSVIYFIKVMDNTLLPFVLDEKTSDER